MRNGPLLAAAVNLNGPGRYLHWSIFTVSEANLVLIAVMVVIFGAALLLHFPDHEAGDQAPTPGDGEKGPTGPSAGGAVPTSPRALIFTKSFLHCFAVPSCSLKTCPCAASSRGSSPAHMPGSPLS